MKKKPMAKKMSAMDKFEKSAVDKKMDRITGYKEGSKKDVALDKLVMKSKKK